MLDTNSYVDIESGERETVFFFMLNAFLCSRIDTANDSEGDEVVNVYMAYLLESLVDGSFYTNHGDRLAVTPVDVFAKVEEHDEARHKLEVYRRNADFRLVAFALFDGWGEYESRYRKNITPKDSYLDEARQYYGWASSFCNRLPDKYSGLSDTLDKISSSFDCYVDVLNHMSSNYMHLLRRLTVGEMFHLEREAHEAAMPDIEEQALDRLLDSYNSWREAASDDTRKNFESECLRYGEIREEFSPDWFTWSPTNAAEAAG